MSSPGKLLPQSFYRRPVRTVALDLLGHCLRHGQVLLRITEVEAYGGPGDTASHGRFGRTARNAPMWGPGGHAYVYLCYGMHQMLNLVTGQAGDAAAVLIRGCVVLGGLETVQSRRRSAGSGEDLLAGPGKVAQALGVDRSYNNHPLYRSGGLEVREGWPGEGILVGPRVGIPYAAPPDREAALRFVLEGRMRVAERENLSPL